MENHYLLRDAANRRRNIVMVRRAIEALSRCIDLLEDDRRAQMRVALAALEGQFRRLVES